MILLVIMGVGFHAPAGFASIVWRADFESYADEQAITLNNTGDDDTFEAHAIFNAGVGGAGIFDAEATPNASFLTGNAAEWYRTASGAGVSATTDIRRRNFSIDFTKSLVLSFDAKETGSTPNATSLYFEAGGQRLTGGTDLSFSVGVGNFRRVTMVANRTASPVDLPGTLLDLQSNQVVLYTKDSGGTYVEVNRANVNPLHYTTNVTGFILRTFNTNLTWQWTYDNFVLADELDARDRTTDINILEWSPGVLAINAIPEPAAVTLLLCGGVALWRRGGERRTKYEAMEEIKEEK